MRWVLASAAWMFGECMCDFHLIDTAYPFHQPCAFRGPVNQDTGNKLRSLCELSLSIKLPLLVFHPFVNLLSAKYYATIRKMIDCSRMCRGFYEQNSIKNRIVTASKPVSQASLTAHMTTPVKTTACLTVAILSQRCCVS